MMTNDELETLDLQSSFDASSDDDWSWTLTQESYQQRNQYFRLQNANEFWKFLKNLNKINKNITKLETVPEGSFP